MCGEKGEMRLVKIHPHSSTSDEIEEMTSS